MDYTTLHYTTLLLCGLHTKSVWTDYKARANIKVLCYQTLLKIKATDVSSWHKFLIILQQYLIANELVYFYDQNLVYGQKESIPYGQTEVSI